VSACLPNYIITEYFVNFEETSQEIMEKPFKIEKSHIFLPETPGLGVELIEEELIKRIAKTQQPLRDLRNYTQEIP
jgi:galactonate dehydratase